MLALVTTWLLVAAPADAGPVELRWDAPSACPGEPELRAAVELLLGAPLSESRPRRMTVIAAVQARELGWSLRIFTVTTSGTRERALRRDRDCATLARAAAVLIAMAIDPSVLARLDPDSIALLDAPNDAPPASVTPPVDPDPATTPIDPAPPHEPGPPPVDSNPSAAASPPPDEPAAQGPSIPARHRPRGALRLAGGLGWGDLPAVGGGLGVASALVWPRVRVEALTYLWPARRVRVDAAGAGGNFLLWTLGARACPVFHPHRVLELPVCAGFEAGRLHVRGVELQNATSVRSTWFAAVLAPALVYRPTRTLALWLAPELVIPVVRTVFGVVAVGPIHQAQPALVRVLLGVELRFPRAHVMDRYPMRNKQRAAP